MKDERPSHKFRLAVALTDAELEQVNGGYWGETDSDGDGADFGEGSDWTGGDSFSCSTGLTFSDGGGSLGFVNGAMVPNDGTSIRTPSPIMGVRG